MKNFFSFHSFFSSFLCAVNNGTVNHCFFYMFIENPCWVYTFTNDSIQLPSFDLSMSPLGVCKGKKSHHNGTMKWERIPWLGSRSGFVCVKQAWCVSVYGKVIEAPSTYKEPLVSKTFGAEINFRNKASEHQTFISAHSLLFLSISWLIENDSSKLTLMSGFFFSLLFRISEAVKEELMDVEKSFFIFSQERKKGKKNNIKFHSFYGRVNETMKNEKNSLLPIEINIPKRFWSKGNCNILHREKMLSFLFLKMGKK